MDRQRRLAAVRERIEEAGADGLLVTGAENRLYLSGFTGSAGMLCISGRSARLLTDFRYVEQAAAEAPLFDVVRITGDAGAALKNVVTADGIRRLGFEAEHLTFGSYQKLRDALDATELVPLKGVVDTLRAVKDDEELAAIERAVTITEAALAEMLPLVGSGAPEQEIALELEYRIRKKGAQGVPFQPIVASGPRSALPHASPGRRVPGHGDLVILDLGAVYQHYCSDLTRTVVVGEAGPAESRLYGVVRRAQEAALAAIRPGLTGTQADAVARAVIADEGYGEHFGHGLGHGVGLAVHEGPRLGTESEDVLVEGMVVTVEPGVYIPGRGGVRIEDLVVVTGSGCRVLTRSGKDLTAV